MTPAFLGVYQPDEINEWILYILEDSVSLCVPATYHQTYRPILWGEK